MKPTTAVRRLRMPSAMMASTHAAPKPRIQVQVMRVDVTEVKEVQRIPR